MNIKVLIVQLEPIPRDINKNIKKVEKLLTDSGFSSSDVIILPELWTIGWYGLNFNQFSQNFYESETYEFLKSLAVKYNSNIIGGSSVLKKDGEKDRNTCIILNRHGDLVKTYDKYHLFSLRNQSEGLYLEEGLGPVIADLDIGKAGISICYDIRFPEQFRTYAFNGSDFMVNMAAWPDDFKDMYVTLAKARAIENQTYFLCSCLTGKINEIHKYSGNSLAIDYKGNVISSLGKEEKVLSVEIDLEKMKEYRQNMPILSDTKNEYKILES